MSGAAIAVMLRIDLRVLARRLWVQMTTLAGLVIIAIVAIFAAGDSGQAQIDALRSDSASLLLIGGLVVAVGLGGGAFSRDASSGYLGLLVGSGATPSRVGAIRITARILALAAIFAIWGVSMQLASLAIGRGFDGALAVHTLAALENAGLVLCASAALASVIGPIAAGVFGIMVFITAQAVVNLKADLDQGAIERSSRSFIDPVYSVLPRAIVSPMIAELQHRSDAGPAAPTININGLTVYVPASHLSDVLWTLLWTLIFAGLATYGVRRRQL
jgi:hypothetical protein